MECDLEELEATKNREKTADELFTELGYTKSFTQLGDIKYYKDDDNVIYFELKYKSFHKSGAYDGMHDGITMEELQAINKKVEELRMEVKRCEYCQEDFDGWYKPLDKNGHLCIFDKPHERILDVSWYGHKMQININYCPMCR